jgi:hypothetical protein
LVQIWTKSCKRATKTCKKQPESVGFHNLFCKSVSSPCGLCQSVIGALFQSPRPRPEEKKYDERLAEGLGNPLSSEAKVAATLNQEREKVEGTEGCETGKGAAGGGAAAGTAGGEAGQGAAKGAGEGAGKGGEARAAKGTEGRAERESEEEAEEGANGGSDGEINSESHGWTRRMTWSPSCST